MGDDGRTMTDVEEACRIPSDARSMNEYTLRLTAALKNCKCSDDTAHSAATQILANHNVKDWDDVLERARKMNDAMLTLCTASNIVQWAHRQSVELGQTGDSAA